MKMKNKRILYLTLALTLAVFALVMQPTHSGYAGGGIIEVNTVDDNDDGVCNATHCSLREAIDWANTMPGTPTITFDIPGAGPHVINLCHALPQLTSSGTTIDGTTEPSYSGTPVVVLQPAFLSDTPPPLTHVPPCIPPSVGLWIETDDITVRGLSIVGFRQTWPAIAAGIVVANGSNNLIDANYIGLDAGGSPDGNRDGILLGAAGQEIRHNTISGNDNGIHVRAGEQKIYANRIGTDFSGSTSGTGMGNYRGIYIEASAGANIIGSSDPTHKNVISGNTAVGIEVESDDNIIQGNHIGCNLIGDTALGQQEGVSLGGNSNLLGGSNAGEGNLISGNDIDGVIIGWNSSGHQILGNIIGADASGTASLGNFVGIFTIGGDNIVIGNNSALGGNLIAFNGHHGIMLLADAHTYHIAGNTITQNGGDGIILGTFSANPATPQQITINRNSIFDNGELGVDLFPDGVTPNDPGDADTGANTLLNFPELSQVTATDAQGTACTGCRVEAFIADGDPSGYGEGMTFVGEAFTDSSGNFSVPLDVNLVSTCDLITTRATDGSGNSSEFSENMRVSPCFVMRRPWLFAPPLLLGLLGLLGGRRAGRGKPGLASAAGGAAIGAGIGGGLVVLAIVLPVVHIEKPQEDAGLPAVQMPCDRFLDPAGLSPADGSIFEIDDNDWDFTWSPSAEMPDGEFRWLVELLGPDGSMQQLSTIGNSLPFLSFDTEISQGAVFSWRLSAEQAIPGTDRWEPFCRQMGWRSFQFGERPPLNAPPWTPDEWSQPEDSPTPTSSPTATSTPTPEEMTCVYEALQNANCRASDYSEAAQISILMQGETAELLALNPEFTHGQFNLGQGACWIWLGLLDGPEDPFANCGVPVLDPPPPPTDTPTPPACTPDLNEEMCIKSGGTWPEGETTKPRCVCPD
jgi:CSLREA domain-containing protein